MKARIVLWLLLIVFGFGLPTALFIGLVVWNVSTTEGCHIFVAGFTGALFVVWALKIGKYAVQNHPWKKEPEPFRTFSRIHP